MKNYFSKIGTFAFLISTMFICTACPDDPEPDPELTVSPTNLDFDVKADSKPVTITSNVGWTVIANKSWITVNQLSGKDNSTIYVDVEENKELEKRTGIITITASEGGIARTIQVSQKCVTAQLEVSPTSASLLSDKSSTTNLTVTATGSWNLTGCPDWLHASATSGVGNTTITLTALTENWSDEIRSTVLTVTANTLSATATVSQLPSLPSGLRVETSNETLMSDGFAYDLKFGPDAKGYKEAFFTESAYLTMTDRDIYNELMKKTEYNKLADLSFLPGFVDPGTKLIYCVAAYGNENNADGTHKYGPITIKRITTKQQTLENDMSLSFSYNSTQWKVTADRKGQYGQKCDEYYYLAAEDDFAELLSLYYQYYTYAVIAHVYFKPMIAENPNQNYKYGPQTMTWSRNGDKFFCITWGIDRDTKNFSADLSDPVYRDLTSAARELKRNKTSQADLNKPHSYPSRTEINNLRNAIRIYKAK